LAKDLADLSSLTQNDFAAFQAIIEASGGDPKARADATKALELGDYAQSQGDYAKQQGDSAKSVVDAGQTILAAVPAAQDARDAAIAAQGAAQTTAAAISQKLVAISNPDGSDGFSIGWLAGDVFQAHTRFKNAPGCPIENSYLDAIADSAGDAATRAPQSYLSGPLQHVFAIGIPDPAAPGTLAVLFGVRATGQIDNPAFAGLFGEVLASQDAPKQQLLPRKNALGFGHYGFRKARR
jgi:hypothetical protein